MVSSNVQVATIELMLTSADAAKSIGGGKPKGGTPDKASLGLRKKAGGIAGAVGGAIKGGAAKLPGAGGAGAAVGKIPKPDPKMMSMAKESVKHAGATAKGAGKTVGIQAGLSSILKQSQLFTGIIGTIFQIVGMLVDVIIMPFMPIIIPVIKMLAWMVPKLMWFSQKLQIGIQALVDGIGWFFKNIDNAFMWVVTGKWIGPMVEGIGNAAKAVWGWVKNPSEWFSGPLHPIKGFFEIIKGIINIIIDIIKGAWSIAKIIIQGIWSIVKLIFSVYKAIFKLYFDIIKAVINIYISIFKAAWSIGKTVIEGIWSFIQTAYSGIKDFISGVFDGIKAFFSATWEIFKGLFNGAVDFIKGIPGKIWGFLQDVWGLIKGWASTFANAVITVKDWAVGILQKIKDFFVGVWNTAKNWFTTAKQWLIDKIKSWASTFISAIITVKGWTIGIFQKIKDFFLNTWTTIKNWFATARQWIIDRLKSWLANFVTGVLLIKDKVVEFYQKMKDFFNGVWNGAKAWVLNRITNIKDFFTGLWDGAKSIFTFIKDKVYSIFNKIDTIRLKILDIISTINPLNWIPKIIEKIKSIIPGVGDVVDAIPGVGAVKNVAAKLKFWQHGAIVRQPTLGIAGERGPEAIIPLRNLTRAAVSVPSTVNITVINRTDDGRENQNTFIVEKHETAENNHEFEFNTGGLAGLWGNI